MKFTEKIRNDTLTLSENLNLSIIKPSKKGYNDEISKNIFKYFEVKFSEIRLESENLHHCEMHFYTDLLAGNFMILSLINKFSCSHCLEIFSSANMVITFYMEYIYYHWTFGWLKRYKTINRLPPPPPHPLRTRPPLPVPLGPASV